MANCDAACQKIIINSGLMAPIARRLAADLAVAEESAVLQEALRSLAADADLLTDVYSFLTKRGVVTITEPVRWSGCGAAETLVYWLRDGVPGDALSVLHQWRELLRAQLRLLVAEGNAG
jgi:hypothetical protein